MQSRDKKQILTLVVILVLLVLGYVAMLFVKARGVSYKDAGIRPFKPSDVTQIKVNNHSKQLKYSLSLDKGHWYLNPGNFLASTPLISSMINVMAVAQVQDQMSDGIGRGRYGLGPNEGLEMAFLSGNKVLRRVFIGRAGNLQYYSFSSNGPVYSFKEVQNTTPFLTGGGNLRDSVFLRLDTAKVTRIQEMQGANKSVFSWSKVGTAEWKDASGKTIPFTSVGTILTFFSQMHSSSFSPTGYKLPMASPKRRIIFTLSDGSQQDVSFYGKNESGMYIAQTSLRKEPFFLVPTTIDTTVWSTISQALSKKK